jgi:hypothetical protein
MRFIIEQLRIKLPPINPTALITFQKTQTMALLLNINTACLIKKYAKKEYKRNLKLIAIKITNNTEDLVFGDLVLTYDDNTMLYVMEKETVYKC